MTGRIKKRYYVLAAFRDLEARTGRISFSQEEILSEYPQIGPGTVGPHLHSFMNNGKNHRGRGKEEVRFTPGAVGMFELTDKGRLALDELPIVGL